MKAGSIRMLVDEIGLTFVRIQEYLLTSALTPVWRLADGRVESAGLRASTIVNRHGTHEATDPADLLGAMPRRLLEPAIFAMHVRNFLHTSHLSDGGQQRLFVSPRDVEDEFASLARAEAEAEGLEPAAVVVEIEAGGDGFERARQAVARAGFSLSVIGLGPSDAASAAVSAARPAVIRLDRQWLLGAIGHKGAAPLLPPLFDSIRNAGMEAHVAGLSESGEVQAVADLGSLLIEGTGFDEAEDLDAALSGEARSEARSNVVSIRR